MPKLSSENVFIDLSDYGRPMALRAAKILNPTWVSPVQVTLLFGLCGLAGIFALLHGFSFFPGLLLILKSIIDAVDGELARIRVRPSYTGRYLDSIFDNILNLLLMLAVGLVTHTPMYLSLMAYASMQLQGTLYNYYYVILRRKSVGGDTTSQVFETSIPRAFPYESQRIVSALFVVFVALYGIYDRLIYTVDRAASKSKSFPTWFMTLVSMYGLGFQLLIIAVMLACGLIAWVIPFFIGFNLGLVVLILIRKTLLE